MIDYILYQPETGAILRVGRSSNPEGQVHSSLAWLPGVADPDLDMIVDGEVVRKSTADEFVLSQRWQELRQHRDALLAASDWTQLNGANVDVKAWQVYRQELRALPDQGEYPDLVQWPTPPGDFSGNIATVRKVALEQVSSWINDFLVQITGPIPTDEKLAWTAKSDAARAYLADAATPLQLSILQPEADMRQITLTDLAQRVVAKANLYTTVVAYTAGLRDNIWEAIKVAPDEAGVAAAMEAGQAQARGLAASLGLQV